MNTSTTTPKMAPKFSHRISILGDEAKPFLLSDAIDTMAYQATNTLTLVMSQLLDDEGGNRASDEVMYWALNSVEYLIKDMQSLAKAYQEAQAKEGV